jgi:hypothetical protein
LNVMVPYPATDIWEDAKGRGLVSENMDWDRLNMDFVQNNDKFIVIDDAVSKQELNNMYYLIKNVTKEKISFSRRSKNKLLDASHMGVVPFTVKTLHTMNPPDSLLSSGYRILKKFGIAKIV